MERFKALEKEMKMKAFSKEGLIAQSRMDPAEKAKRDMVEWIGNTIDELSRQIEQTEAEAEQLQTGKKKKTTGDRLGELETLNERRQWHIGRLEVVQRMLENGQLQLEQVETIQEDVKYFTEANAVRPITSCAVTADIPVGGGLRLRCGYIRRPQLTRRGGLYARLHKHRRHVQPRLCFNGRSSGSAKDAGEGGEREEVDTVEQAGYHTAGGATA